MKKKLCPQCKIAALYVKNEKGERRLIYVTAEGEVVPKYPDESLDGFDISEVFCLGCSWHGSPQRFPKYPDESLDGFDISEVFCLGCSWHGSPQRLVKN